jgi:ATP-dependent DNA helicase RecG
MVIEDAHRFGLSQLHQLRGRVGRGSIQSYCILVGDLRSGDAQQRLGAMREHSNGFTIAEIDLRLRGAGDLAGTRQSGDIQFKVADLLQDTKLLEEARSVAIRLVEQDPNLSLPIYKVLLERVTQKHSIHSLIATS